MINTNLAKHVPLRLDSVLAGSVRGSLLGSLHELMSHCDTSNETNSSQRRLVEGSKGSFDMTVYLVLRRSIAVVGHGTSSQNARVREQKTELLNGRF